MRHFLLRWLVSSLGLFGVILVLTWVSSLVAGRPYALGAYTSIQFVLNTNAAALASTLGILMAIVLLVVQLTAQRYSFNVIGMFVGDPKNVALVVLFIVTIGFNLWLAATLDDGYIPQVGTFLALGLTTVCFGLLIPYFGYLFETLTPQELLDRLQRETLAAIYEAGRGRDVEDARRVAYERVHQTGDIMRTAITLGDGDVATRSVWAFYATLTAYLAHKRSLPDDWFAVEERLFRRRHALVSEEIEQSRTWFERHVLEEIQAAFTGSLNRLESVNTAVALSCRLAGEQALKDHHESALHLLIKFFNTLLRAALNARDGRTGYHLLYQYELLGEAALHARPEVAVEIAHRIAYYGEAALGLDLVLVVAAAGHDVRTLTEASTRSGVHRDMVILLQGELLRLLRTAESRQSPAVDLLRKTAIAVAAFHLSHDDRDLALAIGRGLRPANGDALAGLVAELESVTAPEFWELNDRFTNFDYVENEPRRRLRDVLALTGDGSAISQRGRVLE